MKQESLITAKDVAKILGVHQTTVSKLAREGNLPHIKIGTKYRFLPSAIQAYIGSGRQAEAKKPAKPRREKLSVHIDTDVMEMLAEAVRQTPTKTLPEFVQDAILNELDRAEIAPPQPRFHGVKISTSEAALLEILEDNPNMLLSAKQIKERMAEMGHDEHRATNAMARLSKADVIERAGYGIYRANRYRSAVMNTVTGVVIAPPAANGSAVTYSSASA